MIDLAAFYAAVANEGALPQPHGIDSIEQNGRTIYQYPNAPLPRIGAADPAAFYQLKTILQGVVARGTARAIGGLSPYVAGKTGTTEDAVDGWFVGFTNDVTIAVWVGYDNGDGKRRSLGSSETGAKVALPIFEPILQAVWAEHIAPKAPLSGPSPEAQHELVDIPIDYASGDRVSGKGGFLEHFKRGPDGHVDDTQFQLVSRENIYAWRNQGQPQEQNDGWGWFWGNNNNQGFFGGPSYNGQGPYSQGAGRNYYPNRGWQQAAPPPQPQQPPPQPVARGLFQPWNSPNDQRPAPRRDPDYWGGRFN